MFLLFISTETEVVMFLTAPHLKLLDSLCHHMTAAHASAAFPTEDESMPYSTLYHTVLSLRKGLQPENNFRSTYHRFNTHSATSIYIYFSF